jgi:uncharacterized protein
MAVIVSDTSPIRALHHLGQVAWLNQLFGDVLVPPAVANELANPAPRYASIDVNAYAFLLVRAPSTSPRLAELLAELDVGEAEALALAEEVNAQAVLIDEADGRRVAQRMGLPVLGTVGILIKCKAASLCPAIAPLLDRLEHELGFYLSADFRAQALKLAGE